CRVAPKEFQVGQRSFLIYTIAIRTSRFTYDASPAPYSSCRRNQELLVGARSPRGQCERSLFAFHKKNRELRVLQESLCVGRQVQVMVAGNADVFVLFSSIGVTLRAITANASPDVANAGQVIGEEESR